MRPNFLATGSMTSEQGNKLGIGNCRGIHCEYENQQVINFIKHPFTITLIANNKANTGMLLALENAFELNKLQELL